MTPTLLSCSYPSILFSSSLSVVNTLRLFNHLVSNEIERDFFHDDTEDVSPQLAILITVYGFSST